MSETPFPPDPNLSAGVSTRTRGKKGKGKASTSSEPIDPFQPSSSLRRSVLTPQPNSDDSDIASPESVDLIEPNQPHQPDSGYHGDSHTPAPSTHPGTTEEVPRNTESPEPHTSMADYNNADQSWQGTPFTRQQWASLAGLIRNSTQGNGGNGQPPNNGNGQPPNNGNGDNGLDNTPPPD